MVIKNFEIKVDVQKGSQRFKGKNDTWMLFLLKFNDINLGLDYYELHFMNKKIYNHFLIVKRKCIIYFLKACLFHNLICIYSGGIYHTKLNKIV